MKYQIFINLSDNYFIHLNGICRALFSRLFECTVIHFIMYSAEAAGYRLNKENTQTATDRESRKERLQSRIDECEGGVEVMTRMAL